MRIGMGYDVHKLVENRDLYLGGVKVDYPLGLLGHSDADVLIHAIMDAILGAMAMDDIGKLFPDTDKAYKDISSVILLEKVVSLMQENKYRIVNLDTVLICEYPKINPIREDIRVSLSKVLKTDIKNISIKASTSEKLGFTGRGEGIEARAIILLEEI